MTVSLIHSGVFSRVDNVIMRVDEYYKIVIPHRHWSTEFKMASRIMYGVCHIEHHPILRPNRNRRPRVYACGFHLTDKPQVYAPVWPGHKPNFCVVGCFLEANIYSYLPVDIVKIILKYL